MLMDSKVSYLMTTRRGGRGNVEGKSEIERTTTTTKTTVQYVQTSWEIFFVVSLRDRSLLSSQYHHMTPINNLW